MKETTATAMTSARNKALRRWSRAALFTLVSLTLNTHLNAQDSTAPVTFTQQTTPNPRPNSFLSAISGSSETNIWAVGTTTPGAVALHFNGSTWRSVTMAASANANMSGVSVLAPADVWAVGSSFNASAQHTTSLIEHFDGKKWSVVPSPHFQAGERLFGVKAFARNDVFAVGESGTDNNKFRPLIEHFDGTAWTVVPVPALKPGQTQSLHAVAATSHSDVWVTGFNGPVFSGAIMHFDGQKFSNVPFPSLSSVNLGQVAALATNDAWVVGAKATGIVSSTLTAHWDGQKWTIVPSPNQTSTNVLGAVSAISSDDVWAVGCGICGFDTGAGSVLVEHFDGTQWTINSVPELGNGSIGNSVLTFPTGDIFVGGFVSGLPDFADTLILHGKEGQ